MGVDSREQSRQRQPLGSSSPGPVLFAVLVALECRDKQMPWATTETVAGSAHHLWEVVVFAEGKAPPRGEQTKASEVEVWVYLH